MQTSHEPFIIIRIFALHNLLQKSFRDAFFSIKFSYFSDLSVLNYSCFLIPFHSLQNIKSYILLSSGFALLFCWSLHEWAFHHSMSGSLHTNRARTQDKYKSFFFSVDGGKSLLRCPQTAVPRPCGVAVL